MRRIRVKNIIEVKDLHKSYTAKKEVVKGIQFEVEEGEFFAFLGPNGAGKSTTINMMCTMLLPSSGNIIVDGYDAVKEEDRVRNSIGIVFQENTLDGNLTAYENLLMHCKFYKIPKAERKDRIDHVLKTVALLERKNQKVKAFSGGMKRRLEIARAILHQPKVLFLDEPTVGLDVQTRQYIWDYILELKENKKITIFLTTHQMEEAEPCDRIAIMDYGQIIALDTPKQLKENLGGDVIQIGTDSPEKLIEEIKTKYQIEAKCQEKTVSFYIDKGNYFIADFLKDITTEIDSVQIHQPTLNDVFLKLTGRDMRESVTGY